MTFINQIAIVLMVTTCAGIIHGSPTWSKMALAGSSRIPRPMSVEEMAMFDAYPYTVGDDELINELRTQQQRKRSDDPTAHFSRMQRHQELTNLYGKIAKEFPFLVKQGLLRPGDRKVSIDDLLSMTVFGQPKMGKK